VTAAPASAQSAGDTPAHWDHRAESASAYAKLRQGRVSFAIVTPDRRVRGRGIHARYDSASVVKAMLMVAYLGQPSVRGRSLNARDKALLRPMITRSDNGAASRVRNVVGNVALERLARRVRMKDFATARSWGSTRISAFDQARFFRRIGAFVPNRHRGYALTLLANVVPVQRWGLPQVLPHGWRIYFKGGWRREGRGRLVHQVALLERGKTRIAIAVMTDGDPTYGYGIATVRGVGKRLLAHLGAPGDG
jgi:hypothetical protein